MGEENYWQNGGLVQRPWLLDRADLWLNLVGKCLFWLIDSSGKI